LLNRHDETFVAETHAIRLQLSGRELVQSTENNASNPAVIFADPNYDAPLSDAASTSNLENQSLSLKNAIRLPNVQRLKFTADEAEAISPAIERITKEKPSKLLRDAALESTFKKLAGPSVVVLSTHGFTLPPKDAPSNPLLRCGLLLSGVNSHTSIASLQNDGVLTGLEIARTDLSGTQLAVLSACQTGLGELESTGGVVGLRRAFRIAGARSVLSSLWVVPDRDTMLLMKGFFESYAETNQLAFALQTSQRERIASHRKRFGAAHPFFWAAFVLTGDASIRP
ncbi:MAG: CHAT domain-containing protein, partial [Rhodopirellula sp. JB044]|uniref:CHAT domain-containing protein n=1 Tax=Rhodopirellula sp. JB044 TaxID=3342844 RepID=UPI00370C2A23